MKDIFGEQMYRYIGNSLSSVVHSIEETRVKMIHLVPVGAETYLLTRKFVYFVFVTLLI